MRGGAGGAVAGGELGAIVAAGVAACVRARAQGAITLPPAGDHHGYRRALPCSRCARAR